MCDTFVSLPSTTADGSVLFGKNSDREPNEAQSLEFHPGKKHKKETIIRCTYESLPQAKKTLSVLLSRPFWMWGAEMGANEKGVVIGNEAVFTKMPVNKKDGLTGMDMLRLALERADTAPQAMEIIIQLLSDYGQGGICGYEDKNMGYHNSYIIADPSEAWVLETAGELWAARKVRDHYAISNGLTIGEEYDRSHPELVSRAQEKGWLKKGENFHFARCYSDWFYTTFSACRKRQSQGMNLLRSRKNAMEPASAMSHLRDHGGKDYRPDRHFLATAICAHAANPLSRKSTQTTGSLVAHLRKNRHMYWATGTSAPCTALFKPLDFTCMGQLDTGPVPDALFNPDSLWWSHELFHRTVLKDYQTRLADFLPERDALEKQLLHEASRTDSGKLKGLSQKAFSKGKEMSNEWLNRVQNSKIRQKPTLYYRIYWNRQNKKANIPP
jgi:dipeptidase